MTTGSSHDHARTSSKPSRTGVKNIPEVDADLVFHGGEIGRLDAAVEELERSTSQAINDLLGRVLALEAKAHIHGTPPPDPPDPPIPGRPFPAPVTTQTVNIPANANLNSAISAAADGTVLSFAPAVYTLPAGLRIGKKHLVLKGNGATLRLTGPGSQHASSAFLLTGAEHIAIEDFIVEGGDPGPITANRGEGSQVLDVYGGYGNAPSSYIEITRVRASKVYCDFAYLEGRNSGDRAPSHHVWIHGNTASDLGRNAVSPINVTDVLVEDNDFDRISYHVFDHEPNVREEQVRRITYRRNRIGSYAHRANLIGFFVAGAAFGTGLGAIIADILVENNTVAGIAANGYDGTARGLQSKFLSAGGTRHSNIRFTGNSCPRTVAASQGSGGVLYFKDIDGVTVQGNTQPLTPGSVLTRFDNCTNVVT